MKWKLIFVTAGLTGFTAGLAGSTENEAAGSACATLAGICVGVLEVMVSTTVTIVLDDQSEMGTGAGVFGSLRGAGGVLASKLSSTFPSKLVLTGFRSRDLLHHFHEQARRQHQRQRRSSPGSSRASRHISGAFLDSRANDVTGGDRESARHLSNYRSGWHCNAYSSLRPSFQDHLACYHLFWRLLDHRCLSIKGHR